MSRPRDITSRDTCAVTSPRYVTTTRTRRAPSTPPASRPRDAGRSRPLRRHVPPQHGDVHDVTSCDRDAGRSRPLRRHVPPSTSKFTRTPRRLCAGAGRIRVRLGSGRAVAGCIQGGHVPYAVAPRHPDGGEVGERRGQRKSGGGCGMIGKEAVGRESERARGRGRARASEREGGRASKRE